MNRTTRSALVLATVAGPGAAPWLSGPRLGALDLLAVVVSKWSGTRAHLASSRPDFLALLKRIESDGDAEPVFRHHWPV